MRATPCQLEENETEVHALRMANDEAVKQRQEQAMRRVLNLQLACGFSAWQAMADERNLGLKYAKTFTGESGCDTEVVWEITPKSGGGIDMGLTVPIDAFSCETEAGLRNAIHVYYTGEEVVVLIARKALKEAHYLNATCESGGYKELVRFASVFVCKEAGESVAATVRF